jgi:hypothetical protein
MASEPAQLVMSRSKHAQKFSVDPLITGVILGLALQQHHRPDLERVSQQQQNGGERDHEVDDLLAPAADSSLR